MVVKKRDSVSEERLDRLGRDLVRASAMNEAEAEEAAGSGFLYARLRSRIEQSKERESWLVTLKVIWRAVPAMALVAVLAVALFISASLGARSSDLVSDESPLDIETEGVVFADARNMTSDDVLATILNGDEQEASR
ncbi:MAG TPA: hypothetical protein VJ715_16600 [Pyrinomonadaceae bacterium]|nr:hypothetical protein [Pyrinomonadaceae bacterium]